MLSSRSSTTHKNTTNASVAMYDPSTVLVT